MTEMAAEGRLALLLNGGAVDRDDDELQTLLADYFCYDDDVAQGNSWHS